jgi:DNA-binding transcriptional ArsR family regulator
MQLGRDQRCVCDLQEALGIAPNLLSYHLRILREAGLVEATRRGRWVDYRLSDGAAALIATALPSLSVSGGAVTTRIDAGPTRHRELGRGRRWRRRPGCGGWPMR